MYYYVLRVTNFVDMAAMETMATMHMVNFVNKLKKVKKRDIPYPISTIFISDRQIWYVCVDL